MRISQVTCRSSRGFEKPISRERSSLVTRRRSINDSTTHQGLICAGSDSDTKPRVDTPPLFYIDRRKAFLMVGGILIANSSSSANAEVEESAASGDEPYSTSSRFGYDFISDVPANLKPGQYHTIMVSNRPAVFGLIAQCIQGKKFDKLAMATSQAPFSDLRAAGLYAAWSLLQQNDYLAATECRKAYLDFEVHVQDMKQIAEAVAMDGALPEQVQQSFILLNASLEQLLASIPVQYLYPKD